MKGYPEQLVARAAGVHRRKIVETRRARLAKGADWEMHDGQVCYTEAGLSKLCQALGLDAALVEAEKNSITAAQAAAAVPTPSSAPDAAAEAPASPGEASVPPAEPHSPDTEMPALPAQQSPAVADGNTAAAGSISTGQEAGRDEVTDDTTRPPSDPVAFARRDPAATAVAEKVDELRERAAPIEIEVTRAALANTRVVHGKRLDNGAQVVVRVRDNATFIPGLVIRATPVNGHSFFTMVGHPPRWRGDRHGFTRKDPTA